MVVTLQQAAARVGLVQALLVKMLYEAFICVDAHHSVELDCSGGDVASVELGAEDGVIGRAQPADPVEDYYRDRRFQVLDPQATITALGVDEVRGGGRW